MGAKDSVTKEYLSDNDRFADLCNFYLFDGKQVIHSEDLREQDPAELLSVYETDGTQKVEQKWRDLLKRAVMKRTDVCSYMIIGIENQSEIHYAMPVRNMIYDGMNYGEQISRAAKKHREQKDLRGSAEFLSGFVKGEKLIPVVTITMYRGSKKWDGPRSIHDMLPEMDEELKKYVADYQLNLVAPGEITDFHKFQSILGPILKLFSLAENKEEMKNEIKNNPVYEKIDRESVTVLNTFLGINFKMEEEESMANMCRAWEENRLDGVREGHLCELIKLSLRRFQKGDTVEEVVELFGEDTNLIQKIYNYFTQQAPDYDVDAVCSKLLKTEQN